MEYRLQIVNLIQAKFNDVGRKDSTVDCLSLSGTGVDWLRITFCSTLFADNWWISILVIQAVSLMGPFGGPAVVLSDRRYLCFGNFNSIVPVHVIMECNLFTSYFVFLSGYKLFLNNEGYDCLKRVKEYPLFTLDTSYSPEDEKEVLLDIYYSTNGDQWYEASGWSTTNGTSHCSWYGITCHNNISCIRSIMLAFNNLDGTLPSNIWKIRNLLSLCAPGNPSLRGNIGDFLFGNMSKLITISISPTSIGGDIPEDFAKLTMLQNFLGCPMNGNGFSGRLPVDIGKMMELRLLCLGESKLTGQIPRSISTLNKLFYRNIQNRPASKVHGNLDDLLATPSLTRLFVSGIQLMGEFPRVLSVRFKDLVLTGNNISGTLPETFPKGNNLEHLNVANNQLTGDIPGELLLQPNLRAVDVSQNQFSSINKGNSWPDNASATVSLHISLAGNRNLSINFVSFADLFARTVDISMSSRLSIINVSFCDIKSPLLSNMFYVPQLTTCDFRGSNFYGTIPDIITDNSMLTSLDFSKNNFSGGLPSGILSLNSLQTLDISGNPCMREGTSASSNVFIPDFSRMIKPSEADNFTCPEGRLAFNNGRIRLDPTFYEYKYCVCDDDFYGDNGLCKSCMKGGTCRRRSFSTPEDLRPNITEVSKGYWPSPDPRNATHLVKCPVPSACNPSDSCTCRLDISAKDTRLSSYRPSLSSLTTTCNQSCICHPGNTDRFCSRCQGGFYKLGGLCFQCKKGDLTYYYVFIPIFALSFLVILWSYFYFNVRPLKWFAVTAVHFLLLLIMMLLEFLPAWFFKLNVVVFVLCMTSRGKDARSLLNIAVFHIQTMDFMISSVNVWPRKVVAAQNYLSSYWNLLFPSISCDLPSLFTPIGKFAFLLLLPVVCFAAVGLYFLVKWIYNKFRPNERRLESVHFKCRQLAFFCLNFSYFPIVKQTLSILRPCHSDQDVFYMPNSPWIECSSYTYRNLNSLGFVSLVVYVIGFLVIVVTLVIRFVIHLAPKCSADPVTSLMIRFFPRKRSVSLEDRKRLDAWLGPVYLPYKPKYQPYFEIFTLLRRLSLAFALSMMSSSSTMQTFVVSFVLMLSGIILVCLQPYDKLPSYRLQVAAGNQLEADPRNQLQVTQSENKQKRILPENVFEPVVLFVLSMSFIVLRFAVLDSPNAGGFIWTVLFVNACVLVALVCAIFYRIVTAGNSKDDDDAGTGNGQPNGVSAINDDGSSDGERRHLLCDEGRRVYMPLENAA